MAMATSRDVTNRASAISGLLGNATKVETMTTGLMAGDDSRKARAAAGATPRDMSEPDTGTEAHSQPGTIAPAQPATGTARAGRDGSAFCQNDAGT